MFMRTSKQRKIGLMGGQTIKVGECCVVWNDLGVSSVHHGPKRLFLTGAHTIQFIPKVVASDTQYLEITFKDGKKEHILGPAYEYQNPVVHQSIKVQNLLKVLDNEAIVVHNTIENAENPRRVIHGPCSFYPQPNEYVGTFSWHGPMNDTNYQGRHKAGQNRFTKLVTKMESMPVDVKDVRTSDDCVITVKLIMSYVLNNVDRMLSCTDDPTGDLIGSLHNDIISKVAENTFEKFVALSPSLNELSSFPALTKRAPMIGFDVMKVVYLGYIGGEAMQRMQNDVIRDRSRQRIELERRAQDMQIRDYVLSKEEVLTEKRNRLEELKQNQALSLTKIISEAKREKDTRNEELERKHKLDMQKLESDKLDRMKACGVDLNKYMIADAQAGNSETKSRVRVQIV